MEIHKPKPQYAVTERTRKSTQERPTNQAHSELQKRPFLQISKNVQRKTEDLHPTTTRLQCPKFSPANERPIRNPLQPKFKTSFT